VSVTLGLQKVAVGKDCSTGFMKRNGDILRKPENLSSRTEGMNREEGKDYFVPYKNLFT
jgi:hypothetical protein